MQATIDNYYAKRKHSCLGTSDDISSAKKIKRKLFPNEKRSIPSTSCPPSTPSAGPTMEDFGETSTPTRSPSSQIKLRKELGLGEYRKIVRQSKRYTTLKQHIDTFKETVASFKETEKSLDDLCNSPKLQKFRSVEFEITSPVKRGLLKPKRLFATDTIRSPSKDSTHVSPIKPSFERYSNLISDGKNPLVLPRKYSVLKEMFHWLETIIKIRTERGELITFKKIQPEIQRVIKKNFTEEHLGKIMAIYPAAYELTQQRVKSCITHDEPFELVIGIPAGSDNTSERQKKFNDLLLEKTKLHHKEFLETLDPPLNVSTDNLERWHPEFEVDNVPDVESSSIPQPPITKEVLVSAKDILEKTREMISGNKRMQRALSNVIDDKNDAAIQKSEPISSPTPSNPISAFEKALKGIPKSILERIRAKQAAKMTQMITQSPVEAKEVAMLSRLPELAKILRIVFVNEKKGILPQEVVLERVCQSFKEKMQRKDMIEHLQLISKHVPGWMNFCIVRNISYIRLSKDADMTRIVGKLKNLSNAA